MNNLLFLKYFGNLIAKLNFAAISYFCKYMCLHLWVHVNIYVKYINVSLHTHISNNIYENITAVLEIYALVKRMCVNFKLTPLFSSKIIVGHNSKLVFIRNNLGQDLLPPYYEYV